MPESTLLRLSEVASVLRVSINTLKKMLANGEIGYVQVRGRRKIDASHLAEYVARNNHAAIGA